ncbi:hypothetical protein LCGC14_1233180, partial [marine sediment metagenome]
MSNPQNILAKYRTYAYHHILIACDNEAAARFIRESNRLSAFRDLRSQRPITIDDKEKLVPLTTDDKVQIGSYVVILNGMINSNFIVRDVEWFTSTAASTDQQDKFTSIAVEGKMTVEEWAEVQEIRARIGKNMGIIADYIRGDAGVKIRQLSRAVQLYQQRQQLGKLREDIGGF